MITVMISTIYLITVIYFLISVINGGTFVTPYILSILIFAISTNNYSIKFSNVPTNNATVTIISDDFSISFMPNSRIKTTKVATQGK